MSIRRRSEDGAVLLLALAFITAISVMITALLYAGFNAYASTHGLTGVLATQYTADAAVQEAINALPYTGNTAQEFGWFGNTGTPLTSTCPTAPGDLGGNGNPNQNSVTLNNVTVYAYCTFISDSFLVRNIEITACTTSLPTIPVFNTFPVPATTPAPNGCPQPLLRTYVTLSQQAPIDPVTVTVDDWSVLYGNAT